MLKRLEEKKTIFASIFIKIIHVQMCKQSSLSKQWACPWSYLTVKTTNHHPKNKLDTLLQSGKTNISTSKSDHKLMEHHIQVFSLFHFHSDNIVFYDDLAYWLPPVC